MKNTLTIFAFCMALCCAGVTNAQYRMTQPPSYPIVNQPGATLVQVIDTMQAYTDPTDTGEGNSIDQLQAFKAFWLPRVVFNDSSGHNMFDEYYKALRAAVIDGEASPCTGSGFSGDWTCIGPDSLPAQQMGYLNAVWASPTDTNYILAGSDEGGLFKTTDGKNWANITDNAPFVGGVMGVDQITVNPQNINTIYLGTVNAGILESFDGGNTWTQEFIGYGGYGDSIESAQFVFMTPDTQRLYAFVGDSIYTRTNGSPIGAWVNITPPGVDSNSSWWDLQFVPGNQNHFFISNTLGAGHSQAGIWASDAAVPGPSDWTKITSGFTGVLYGSYTFGYDTVNATSWDVMSVALSSYMAYFSGSCTGGSYKINHAKYFLDN